MELAELYDLIRKDEVGLFVGAGFSAYAGFPLGGKLKEIIYERLNEEEKKEISLNQPLSKVAQDFVTIRGNKSELNMILQNEFQKLPLATHNHDKLSRVAFFKTIVTTNYDTLIEDSYTKRAIVISKPLDIIVPKQNKTRIFKIHGTIEDVDSLIITDEDYSKLYNIQYNNPFWASVLAELASKHIIFIGYGYEDLNIWAIFQKIFDHTKEQGKRRFFISPTITDLKKKFLNQNNIIHYELTAETFLNGLEENIKKHLKHDVDNKMVSLQTATEIFENYNLKVNLEVAANGNLVKNLENQSGLTNQELNFSIVGKRTISKFKKFQDGKMGQSLTFTSRELKDFRHSIEGFDFINLSQVVNLTVEMLPSFSQKCSIRFIDDDFELDDIYYDVYHTNGSIKVVIDKFKFKITIDLDVSKQPKADFKIIIKEPEKLNNINDGIEIYKLATLIFTGKKFNVFFEKSGSLINTSVRTKSKLEKQSIEYYNNKLNIFNAIKQIERVFNLNFQNIETEEILQKIDIISNLQKLIKHKEIYFDEGNGVTFNIEKIGASALNSLKERLKDGIGLLHWIQDSSPIILFNNDLKLGKEEIFIKQAYIAELTTDFVTIKSGIKKFGHRYEVFGLLKVENDKALW